MIEVQLTMLLGNLKNIYLLSFPQNDLVEEFYFSIIQCDNEQFVFLIPLGQTLLV